MPFTAQEFIAIVWMVGFIVHSTRMIYLLKSGKKQLPASILVLPKEMLIPLLAVGIIIIGILWWLPYKIFVKFLGGS